MSKKTSPLDRARAGFTPRLPGALTQGGVTLVTEDAATPVFAPMVSEEFPKTLGNKLVRVDAGPAGAPAGPMKVAVVLSGGQAPGGHNVIAGLFDALKKANPASRLYGFTGGPTGIIKNKYIELTSDLIDAHRNTGGFDLIGSGRGKIEKPEELEACRENLTNLEVQALVVIGGDDSNTNAAFLAEDFLAHGLDIRVIGVPKTIDGDMKNEFIEASFGFDSASKVFSELIGSICRDALSAKKYWHFIRLMGRSASHVTLEVALETQPNMALISEEAESKKWTLTDVVGQIAGVVCDRAAAGKSYGVLLIPEGLLEFLADFKDLIAALGGILGERGKEIEACPEGPERVAKVLPWLIGEPKVVYASLPLDAQLVLLTRDSHGNIPVSQLATEQILIHRVKAEVARREMELKKREPESKLKFSPLGHFFGYEGRCVQPSNFDANYCYALGYTAFQLLSNGLTGYTVSARNLAAGVEEWVMGGVPVTWMLNVEKRKGVDKAVIKKSLVDLGGAPFAAFAAGRDGWAVNDDYLFPGPIQYYGPPEVCDLLTRTLALESAGR